MKPLSASPLGMAVFAYFPCFFVLHYFNPSITDVVLFINSALVALIIALIRALTLPAKVAPAVHASLPTEAIRTLRESLHHSQVPLFTHIMEPMLAEAYPLLVHEVIGKKLNEAPLTRFDEKMEILARAFRQLQKPPILYTKRAFDDRDAALTMLVFLRLFWIEKPFPRLPDLLKSMPVALYPMLRREVYRLYDLPLLAASGETLINQAFMPLFAGIDGFYGDKKEVLKEDSTILTSQELPPIKIENTPSCLETVPLATNTTPITENSVEDYLPDFLLWLAKRIESGNKQYSMDSESLVFSNSERYGHQTVFLLPEVLGKYQCRSNIAVEVLEQALREAFSGEKSYRIERHGNPQEVIRTELLASFTANHSTPILEGNPS